MRDLQIDWLKCFVATVDAGSLSSAADEVSRSQSAVSMQLKKLESAVVPLYLQAPEKWGQLMRTTLAFNGSYFNTNRMVKQYTRNAYYPVKLVEQVRVEEAAYAD